MWDDAEIDEGITTALDDYNLAYGYQASATIAAGAGDRSLALPAGADVVVRVVASGRVVPARGEPEGYVLDELQAWEVWDGEIRFTQPLAAGSVEVWYQRAHLVTDVPSGDVGLIVAGGVLAALRVRSVADGKRRLSGLGAALDQASRSYADVWRRRRRRLRVSSIARE